MSDKIKVLIVDDSRLQRNLLSSALDKKKFQVVCVESGAHCLEAILTDKPDIILLDIMMPEINGKDVLLKIRQKYNKVELPVIMVTGKSDASDIIELLSIGANDYVIKDADCRVPLMRIITYIRLMGHFKEIKARNAMIATYNHDVNNGITIALADLKTSTKTNPQESLEKLEAALGRILEVVKKIDALTYHDDVEYDSHASFGEAN